MDSPVWAALVEIKAKIDKLNQDQDEQAHAEEDFVIPEKDLRMELGRERMEHQETLSKLADTESKLSGLSQELTTVRKDFEVYKATNDGRWETMGQWMAQLAAGLVQGASGLVAGPEGLATKPKSPTSLAMEPVDVPGLAVKPNTPSGLAPKPKSPSNLFAKSKECSSLAMEPKDSPTNLKAPSSLFAKPEDPTTMPKGPSGLASDPSDLTQILRLKIAYLEASVHSKTSQISKMEQEHEETVRLMSEQLDSVYSRLQGSHAEETLGPEELEDVRIELLEERNQELQSIIQANVEEAELQNQKIRELEASVRKLKNDKIVVYRSEKLTADDLNGQVKKLTKEKEDLQKRLKTEADMVTRLRELMADQAQKHRVQLALRDAAFADALEKAEAIGK